MSALLVLDAHYNDLAGSLPAAWASQHLSLTYLDLSHNGLTGGCKLLLSWPARSCGTAPVGPAGQTASSSRMLLSALRCRRPRLHLAI